MIGILKQRRAFGRRRQCVLTKIASPILLSMVFSPTQLCSAPAIRCTFHLMFVYCFQVTGFFVRKPGAKLDISEGWLRLRS